jgi:hypothetical protein
MPLQGRPKRTLCGHPKQGVRGTRNQSLAAEAEVGFLGKCQGRLHLARAISQNRTSGPEQLPVSPSTGSNRDHFLQADLIGIGAAVAR